MTIPVELVAILVKMLVETSVYNVELSGSLSLISFSAKDSKQILTISDDNLMNSSGP